MGAFSKPIVVGQWKGVYFNVVKAGLRKFMLRFTT